MNDDPDDVPPENLTQGARDLFMSPAAIQARAQLPPDLQQKFKDFGKHMYGNTALFEESSRIPGMPQPMAEAFLHIELGLKSGLKPSDLTDDETALVKEVKGDGWEKEYGYGTSDSGEAPLSHPSGSDPSVKSGYETCAPVKNEIAWVRRPGDRDPYARHAEAPPPPSPKDWFKSESDSDQDLRIPDS